MKKTVGIFFIILSSVLIIAIIGLLPQFFATFSGIVKIFLGRLDANQTGFVIGYLVGQIVHVTAAYYLMKYGIKFIKDKKPI